MRRHQVPVYAALLLAVAPAFADEPLKAVVDGTRLILSNGDKSVTVDLTHRYPGTGLTQARLLHRAVKQGASYLLLDAVGYSRFVPGTPPPETGGGHCGGGEERALVWIKLGAHFEHLNSVVVPYLSCWETISVADLEAEGGKNIRAGKDGVSIEISRYGGLLKEGDYEISYSFRSPEFPPEIRLKK